MNPEQKKFNGRLFWGIWNVAAFVPVQVAHLHDGLLWTLFLLFLMAGGCWLIVSGWPTTTIIINNKFVDHTGKILFVTKEEHRGNV